MKKIIGLFLLVGVILPAEAQRVLNLDSCRALALRNNKQFGISKLKQDVAINLRKSARTKYLPHVSAVGSYMFTSREISILSDDQKAAIGNIGTTMASDIGPKLQNFGANLTTEQRATIDGLLSSFNMNTDQMLGNLGTQLGGVASSLNAEGQKIVDAFHTDTRNMFVGSIMITQPVFMGGSIVAMNKMADLSEQMAANSVDAKRQYTIYNTDQAYWMVVSLKHKKKLADSYLELVKKLDNDVKKMIREGVVTRSEGLSVDVKVNEAEMTVTQVNDGLVLAKMHLCQLCGLPMNEELTLADEDNEDLSSIEILPKANMDEADSNRPELKVLRNTVEMSKQATNIMKAGNLPQVELVGGYSVSNPNVYNGYQNKFGGVWNIGVMVRVPIWNWGDVTYKVRAAKGATTIATLELEDIREQIELQVNQSSFRVNEANKKLAMAKASTIQAEENLRCANLGFKEGVIQSSTVMEAQTAWVQAQSQRIDAEIDVKLSQVNLKKALGTLQQ